MADFSPQDLLDAAKKRFGATELEMRIRGQQASDVDAEAELLEIAKGVYAKARGAAAASVGWPIPGKAEDGTPFKEKWPPELLQKSLDLFRYRTGAGLSEVPAHERRMGQTAEKYFDEIQRGSMSMAIGGTTDLTAPAPISARDRDGTGLLPGIPDQENMHEAFTDRAWNG